MLDKEEVGRMLRIFYLRAWLLSIIVNEESYCFKTKHINCHTIIFTEKDEFIPSMQKDNSNMFVEIDYVMRF